METSYYIVAYILGAVACGIAGSFRKIGPVAGFFAGLLLSPVFGMGVVLASPSNADIEQNEILEDILDALAPDTEQTE